MRTLSKLTAAFCLCCLLLLSGCKSHSGLTVVFPKLGSADGAVLMTENSTVVIDTGETNDGDELLELLQHYDRNTVDLLIISHYDKDHVGGAAELLAGCTVKRVIGSTSPKDSEEMDAYRAALQKAGLTEEIPTAAQSVTFGDLHLVIDPPKQSAYAQDQSNNSSTVVSVTYLDTHLLFAGDAMTLRTQEFAPKLDEKSYDLIKIPHHGRDTDTAALLLPALKPGAAAVITSSKKEPENQALLDLLEDSGVASYLTRQGTVVVTSDGQALKITQDS